MHIGERIKRLREAKGFSQTELADKMLMDKSQYSKLEKEKADPSISTLEKVTSALGATLSELFSEDTRKDQGHLIELKDKISVHESQMVEVFQEKLKLAESLKSSDSINLISRLIDYALKHEGLISRLKGLLDK